MVTTTFDACDEPSRDRNSSRSMIVPSSGATMASAMRMLSAVGTPHSVRSW